MAIWPISTRINSPKNDDADLLKPLADSNACWPPAVPDASTGGTRRMAACWNSDGAVLREGAMRVGDYPISGKSYWVTMTGVAALGMFGVVLMLAVQ